MAKKPNIKDVTKKLQETDFNTMLVVDEMPELHFGDIIQVNQNGLDLLKQADQAADQAVESDAMSSELNMAGKVLARNRKEIEKLRKNIKQPYLDGGNKVDTQFKIPLDQFDRVINKVRTAVTKYATDKAKKLQEAQDEVDRKNREAAAAAAKKEAANKKNSISHGGTGNIKPVVAEKIAAPIAKIDMSGTTTVKKWKASVIDPTKVPARFLKAPGVIEAIRKEVQKEVNDNKKQLGKMAVIEDATKIPGVAITIDASARF